MNGGGKREDISQMPLLRMLWRRKSPSLLTRHTLDVEFSPITVMYNDQAMTGLLDFFKLPDEDTRDEHDADMVAAAVEQENDGGYHNQLLEA